MMTRGPLWSALLDWSHVVNSVSVMRILLLQSQDLTGLDDVDLEAQKKNKLMATSNLVGVTHAFCCHCHVQMIWTAVWDCSPES